MEYSRQEIEHILYKRRSILHQKESLEKKWRELQKSYLPTEGGYKELWHGLKPFWKKAGIVLGALGVLMALEQPIGQLPYIFINFFGFSAGMCNLLVNVLQCLVILFALAVAQTMANKKIIAYNRENANRLEANKRYNEQIRQQITKINEEIGRVDTMSLEELNVIPGHYWNNIDAVDFMASTFLSHRADTIKEAVNLYHTELHHRQIEEQQEEMIRQQEWANRLAEAQLAADMAERERQRQMQEMYYWQEEERRRRGNGY